MGGERVLLPPDALVLDKGVELDRRTGIVVLMAAAMTPRLRRPRSLNPVTNSCPGKKIRPPTTRQLQCNLDPSTDSAMKGMGPRLTHTMGERLDGTDERRDVPLRAGGTT